MRRLLATAFFALLITCLIPVWPARAAEGTATTSLDRYLNGLTSLKASFTQTVTDAQGKKTDGGNGTFLVQRPGKFRWDYQPAGAGDDARSKGGQLLVADGQNVWFYDRELSQVTVKPVTQALSATPVMLLSGSPQQLHEAFDVVADGSQGGMDWVKVTPRSSDSDFTQARLGFAHNQLVRMQVNDRLGQTVQMDFAHSERNARVSPEDLQFKPPAGVDVIGTPQ
ncbi:MAG TPA: outer membrane lipoprotein chaperone LolA [Steroidobacteraceae bacterium]|jgi:outer membrane lipoprotein carrier protein|nr:outer membrane lipoprotein chaperone LolA [Steroidobacteraceae bacterium]